MPLNGPNLLTLFRFACVPVMVALIAAGESTDLRVAAAVFGIAALTDVADGHLARAKNLVTRFGRIADPIADKLLVGSALLALVAVDRLALIVALVVIAREVGVSALRYHAGLNGITIHVSGFGKAKTGVQMTAIPMLMLVPDPGAMWVGAVLVLVVVVTIASGIDYALTYAREAASASVAPAARW